MKGEIKIIDHKPLISDQEIEAFKDFNSLLSTFQESQHTQTRVGKTRLVGMGTVLIGGLLLLYFFGSDLTTDKEQHVVSPAGENKKITGITVSAPDSSLPVTVPESVPEKEQEKKEPIYPMDKEEREKPNNPKLPEREERKKSPISGGYVPATPASGYDHLYAYLNKELQYPEEAMLDSVQGTLEVHFIITAEGTVEEVRLENSLGQLLDAEAIRVIKSMPEWRPATINGKPIRSSLSIPLRFDIAKHTEK